MNIRTADGITEEQLAAALTAGEETQMAIHIHFVGLAKARPKSLWTEDELTSREFIEMHEAEIDKLLGAAHRRLLLRRAGVLN